MENYETVKARWEKACRRYLDTEGAYPKEARLEMYFLCETLEAILELPKGASSKRVKELAEGKECEA